VNLLGEIERKACDIDIEAAKIANPPKIPAKQDDPKLASRHSSMLARINQPMNEPKMRERNAIVWLSNWGPVKFSMPLAQCSNLFSQFREAVVSRLNSAVSKIGFQKMVKFWAKR